MSFIKQTNKNNKSLNEFWLRFRTQFVTISEVALNASAILSYIFMQRGILKHWQLSNKNIDQLWNASMIIYII